MTTSFVVRRAGLGGLAMVTLVGAPAAALASPPPYDDGPGVSLLPLFVVMGFLALLGIGIGLLRSRQRPGPVYVVAAITGSALLATWAIVLEPPFETRYWATGLLVESLALTTVALAAWVWGDGPERRSRRRVGGVVLAVTLLVAIGAWAFALVRAAGTPYHVSESMPRECGEPAVWSPPESLAPGRWFDWRTARRRAPDGTGEQILAASPVGDWRDVDLVVFREGPDGPRIEGERRIRALGEWMGLASDHAGNAYASWLSTDRRQVTLARIGADLAIADTRQWPAAKIDESPRLSAGEVACITYPIWSQARYQHRVLKVDEALRPVGRAAAVVSQANGGRTLPGWAAIAASALGVAAVIARWLRLRRLARRDHWEGRVLPDGATLETADGTLVRVEPPAGLSPGELRSVIGHRRGEPAGGPYRDAATVVVAERVLPGAWADALGRMRDHEGRIALLVAAAIAILTACAADVLTLVSFGAGS